MTDGKNTLPPANRPGTVRPPETTKVGPHPAPSPHPAPKRSLDGEGEAPPTTTTSDRAVRSLVRAAWLQAVGGVLALIAAFVIGGISERSARAVAEEERHIEGDILAVGLRADLDLLKATFDRLDDAQQGMLSNPDRLLGVVFDVPADLIAARDRFHLLGRDAGLAVQKTLNDAQRVARLLEFIRKDARAYADYYSKRGIADNSGAGTAFYFNAKEFDTAVQSLNGNLNTARRLLAQADGGK